ncbi:MAG: SIS domain-containing protein [Anaerolineae bacterium]|nr:SIS domain-containing protein [Anaerolineae bacterium]
MTPRGESTHAEILSQPFVWASTLDVFKAQAGTVKALLDSGRFDRVIFTGCGSTHYLSMTAAALFQLLTGIPAQARPASEVVLFPDLVLAPKAKTLLVAVSRSGTTTETVEAARLFKARTGSPVLTITCYGDSTLAQVADLVLAADAAQEESVAQTRSFTSMLVLAQALAACAAGIDIAPLAGLSTVGQRLLTDYNDLARQLGENTGIDQFFFLGSGLLYGTACEAMLKMKEMSLSHSEPFHALEFRHGPMSMVTDKTLVTGLISEGVASHEIKVLDEMHAHGAHTLTLIDDQTVVNGGERRGVVRLQSGLPVWARPVLYVPVLQLMAYYRAMAKGQNPDRPAKLEAVVSLDKLV